MKGITKEEAIEICREASMKSAVESIQEWQPGSVTDEPPPGCYMEKEHYETGCWFMTPPSVGETQVVGVSKKTGKIVFSGAVTE